MKNCILHLYFRTRKYICFFTYYFIATVLLIYVGKYLPETQNTQILNFIGQSITIDYTAICFFGLPYFLYLIASLAASLFGTTFIPSIKTISFLSESYNSFIILFFSIGFGVLFVNEEWQIFPRATITLFGSFFLPLILETYILKIK